MRHVVVRCLCMCRLSQHISENCATFWLHSFVEPQGLENHLEAPSPQQHFQSVQLVNAELSQIQRSPLRKPSPQSLIFSTAMTPEAQHST